MNAELHAWATRHAVQPAALADLLAVLLPATDPAHDPAATSEAAVQQSVRIAASAAGWRLFRNNRGAGRLESGSYVRFGLANDSEAIGRQFRSHDLIGIRPVLITAAHVGHTLGIFTSIECKRPGWKYRPNDEHEQGQARWAALVRSLGGYAIFSTGGIE